MDSLRKLHRKFVEWNSFANDDENLDENDRHQLQVNHHIHEQEVREQRISTRIYVVLLNGESTICQDSW